MASLILEIQARGLNQYYKLESFPVTIGRALDNDIILSDNSVSAHHLRLERTAEGEVLAYNLSTENGTRLNGHKLGQQAVTVPLPGQLLLGNRKLRVLSSDMPVENTDTGHCKGPFSVLCQPWAAAGLLIASLAMGGFNDYLNTTRQQDTLFFLSKLLESLLWMLVFTLVVSGVTRLLTHRWEFTPALSVVGLFTLVPLLLQPLGSWLDYFFTSDSPSLWLSTGVGDFLLLPLLLYVFLHSVLKQKRIHAIGIALLLSAFPLGLQVINLLGEMSANNEFSSEPYYNQTLSSLNWHAKPALSLEAYLQQAAEKLPAQVEPAQVEEVEKESVAH